MWALLLLGVVAGAVFGLVLPLIGIVLLLLVVLVALIFAPALSIVGLTGRVSLALSVIAGVAGGWFGARLGSGLIGKRTPKPSAAVVKALDVDSAGLISLSTANRVAVIAYAESLTYADSASSHHPPDRYHGQWDKNLLDTLGNIGLVQPEENIHRNGTGDLAWGSGVVELKITIVPSPARAPAAVSYGGVSFAPGITYVWVDSLVMATRDSGTARALYIPASASYPVQRRVIKVLRGEYAWNRAVARWSPAQCFSCVKYDWCQ